MACLSAAQAGKADDTLVFADKEEVVSFDQYYGNDRIGIIIGHHIFDRLLYRDPASGEIKPMLATDWKWVDDRTLEMHLREGVRFHDGETFEAQDVVYTLQQAIDPNNAIAAVTNVKWIEGVDEVDERTIRIRAKEPFPAALQYLAGPLPIYGKDYYEKVGHEGMNRQPIGSGPYKVESFEAGASVNFVRNEDYWEGSPRGKPQIGRLVLRTIPDVNTQIAELMTGGVDWIWKISKDQAESLKVMPTVEVGPGETMRIGYLSMDAAGRSGDHPLKNKLVRQAIAYGINRNAIRDGLMLEGGRVLDGFCYPKQFGCDQNVQSYPYDPEKSKALLAEAGYPDGFDVTLDAAQDRDLAEAMLGDLRNIGINANLNYGQFAAIRDLKRNGRSTMHFGTNGSFSINDVAALLGFFFSYTSDDMHRDPQIRDDLRIADGTLDEAVRQEHYTKALIRNAQEMYVLPLWSYPIAVAYTTDVDFTIHTDEIPHFDLARWKD